MANSVVGVCIDGGLQPFQIVQQDERGRASVTVRGRCGHPDATGTVQLRIVAEADGGLACPWQAAGRQVDGKWEHTFDHVPAGGLYRLESRLVIDPNAAEWGAHGDTVHHWGVGDLWIIAGQSNAAGYGRGPVHDPPELGVHLLRNDERWDVAAHPLNDTTGSAHPNLEVANPGHSAYLCFARELRAALGYPIGLVQTALGGSPLSAWNLAENSEAPLYRNLLHCVGLAGGRARGMVWYQGELECNATAAPTYEQRFADFIRRLRTDLRSPNLPVIVAQLNRYMAALSDEDHRAWSIVREAQRQAVKLGHVAIVPTVDLSLSDAIHTSSDGNLTLGHRKARAALAMVYGRSVAASAPEIATASLSIDRTAIDLTFNHVPNRLAFLGPGEADFTVEDTEGFVPIRAATTPARDRVRLELQRPAAGEVRVHGGYGANPPCNLRDAEENLPVLGFYGVTASPVEVEGAMKLVFIYGPPAVGKLTVAEELAALTGFKLFHNHVTVDYALSFFEFGTRGFFRVVDAMRLTMFEVAASENLMGLIFTFVYAAGHDDTFIESAIRVVEANGGEVSFVRLHCDPALLEERVATPQRQRFKKLQSVEVLRELMASRDLFSVVPFKESMSLDTTHRSPGQLAREIAMSVGLDEPLALSGGGIVPSKIRTKRAQVATQAVSNKAL